MNPKYRLPAHLTPDCSNDGYCRTCSEPVKQSTESGLGWFITLGHAGFNTRANNRSGYKTRKAAIAAFKKLAPQ